MWFVIHFLNVYTLQCSCPMFSSQYTGVVQSWNIFFLAFNTSTLTIRVVCRSRLQTVHIGFSALFCSILFSYILLFLYFVFFSVFYYSPLFSSIILFLLSFVLFCSCIWPILLHVISILLCFVIFWKIKMGYMDYSPLREVKVGAVRAETRWNVQGSGTRAGLEKHRTAEPPELKNTSLQYFGWTYINRAHPAPVGGGGVLYGSVPQGLKSSAFSKKRRGCHWSAESDAGRHSPSHQSSSDPTGHHSPALM